MSCFNKAPDFFRQELWLPLNDAGKIKKTAFIELENANVPMNERAPHAKALERMPERRMQTATNHYK
jgi:hypothetical protein